MRPFTNPANPTRVGTIGIHLPLANELVKHIPSDYDLLIISCAFGGTGFTTGIAGTYDAAAMKPMNGTGHGGVTGFNLEKRTFASLNCVPVVPGALGAWRKQVVEELGYFTADTLAEDTDMTLKILRQGYKVVIDEQAYAYTEAPETIRDFLKQRFRWTFGTLQCFWRHKKLFGGIKHKSLGFMPSLICFYFNLLFLSSSAFRFIVYLGILAGDAQKTLLIFFSYFLVDSLICLVAFRMEKLSFKPLISLFLQRIFYRYLLLWVTWKSIFAALKGTRVGWGEIKAGGKPDGRARNKGDTHRLNIQDVN